MRREGQRHAPRDRADHGPPTCAGMDGGRALRARRSTSCRRRIEKKALAENLNDFYICSLSARSLIYKGMFLAEVSIDEFLSRPHGRAVRRRRSRSITSATRPTPSPQWSSPSRSACSPTTARSTPLRGNVNWMKSHEIAHGRRGVRRQFGEDVKPVIQPAARTRPRWTTSSRSWCAAGRDAPMAKTLLVPEAWNPRRRIR